ncbi:hypothetical protein D1007_04884 [Hordeum vulgare]|nr:hypothetical protein D1007_04884 [Hordeum vulgare]
MDYEEESNDDNNQDYLGMLCENSQDDEKYEIPTSIEGEEYKSLELELMVFCRKHDKAAERFVAFKGTPTGRRLLACAKQNTLLKLWQMYEDAKYDGRSDNLHSALTIQTLTCEKKSIEDKFQEISKDVDSLFEAQDSRSKEHLYVITEYKKEYER